MSVIEISKTSKVLFSTVKWDYSQVFIFKWYNIL